MTQILTVTIEREGERVGVNYVASDGLSPQVALAAVQAVERELQKAIIEAEVRKRLNVESPDRDLRRTNVGMLEEQAGEAES